MRTTNFLSGFGKFVLALSLTGALGACALAPKDDPDALAEYKAANDPFEPANRLVFAANSAVDAFILQPIAVIYRDLAPDELKPPFENLITNLFMPISFIHALLQGDLERAEMAAQRFVGSLPTLLLGDPMPNKPPVHEDAGQTLGVWGVEAGPYVMLPILGPSNMRDTTGVIIDFFVDPVRYLGQTRWSIGRGASDAVIDRSKNIDTVRDLQRNSLDYYAAVRSLYRQRREAQIVNGDVRNEQPAPTIGLESESVKNAVAIKPGSN